MHPYFGELLMSRGTKMSLIASEIDVIAFLPSPGVLSLAEGVQSICESYQSSFGIWLSIHESLRKAKSQERP